MDEAGDILRAIIGKWRELGAGSEGFLVGHRREGLKGELVVGDGIKLKVKMPVTYFQRSNQQKNTRSPFRVRSHWIKNHATQIDPAHGSKWAKSWYWSGLRVKQSHFRGGTDLARPYIRLSQSLFFPLSEILNSIQIGVLVLSD